MVLKLSKRVSNRGLKLSNYESFRALNIFNRVLIILGPLKISNRVSFRALKLSKWATEYTSLVSNSMFGWSFLMLC